MKSTARLMCRVLIALLGFCILSSTAFAKEIIVAQVAPFSGGVAPYSNATNLGASVLFESVNARGGIQGNKIKLITRDDKFNPEATVALYEEVARTEKPVAFLYPIGPRGITALHHLSIPQKLGIPVIGTIPANYKLRKPVNPYVFHIGLGQDAEVVKMVEHVVTLGMRRIAVVSWNDPDSLNVLDLVIAEAGKHKLEIITRPKVEAGTAKVEGAVAECLKAKPNVIIAVLPVHATGAFVKGMREANDFTPIYGASYTESGLLAKFAGAENARGVGITQVVPNPFGGSIKLVKEYQESMRRYAPKDTRYSSLSFEGFIAAKILVEALRSAGPNINGMTVKAALEKLHSLDLGGLIVNYDPEQHVGLTYLDISVVGPEGRLIY